METDKGSGLRLTDFIQVWRNADKDIPTMGAIKMTINSLVDSVNKHGNYIKIVKTEPETRRKRDGIFYSLDDGVRIAVVKDNPT